jgi:hypothetical protein
MWASVVGLYGTLRPGISLIKLLQPDGTEVVGTIAFDPTDDRFLLFTIDEDTVPANTLTPLTAVINPLVSGPGSGLPAATLGQRYLLTEATGADDSASPIAWQSVGGQPLIANANDIIEYNGTNWTVVFDSSAATVLQYVSNLNTGTQYKWNLNQWVKSFEGEYKNGLWTLVL